MTKENDAPACSGRAAQALAVYRQREAELKAMGEKKPDMKAESELRARWAPERQHGELPGVPVGVTLRGKGEAAILGIHTSILRGIDALKGESCYAVAVSGGYSDDDDHTKDGTIIYTGSGGQKGKRQDEDQIEDRDNASLIRSSATKLPIRVIRKRIVCGKVEYVYDGLYTCESFTYEPSKDGPKVFKFTLKPTDGNRPRSFSVEFDQSASGAPRDSAHRRLDKIITGKRTRPTSEAAVFDDADRNRLVAASPKPSVASNKKARKPSEPAKDDAHSRPAAEKVEQKKKAPPKPKPKPALHQFRNLLNKIK